MYQLGVLGLTSAGHAAVAIGVVRRALDELRHIASTKARMGATAPLREKESFLIALAGLESRARSAACWVRDTFATAEATAIRTGVADPTEVAIGPSVDRARNPRRRGRRAGRLSARRHRRTPSRTVATVLPDMHAASQHFFAGEFATLEAGRALLAAD